MGLHDIDQPQNSTTSDKTDSRKYPTIIRRKLSHLEDFVDNNSDRCVVHTTLDYHYRVI